MKIQFAITTFLIVAVGFALCGAPQLLQAQQAEQGSQPQNQPTTVINGTTVNPAQGPLTPLPSAPEPQQTPAPSGSTTAPSTQLSQRPSQQPATVTTEPLGTAAAENVPTNGGGASRPAGTAIAGEKQHQTRALLLKIGAIAAVGIAVGTIVALSKGTPSTPPGRTSAAARH